MVGACVVRLTWIETTVGRSVESLGQTLLRGLEIGDRLIYVIWLEQTHGLNLGTDSPM